MMTFRSDRRVAGDKFVEIEDCQRRPEPELTEAERKQMAREFAEGLRNAAGLAQTEEPPICNRQVASSNLASGSKSNTKGGFVRHGRVR